MVFGENKKETDKFNPFKIEGFLFLILTRFLFVMAAQMQFTLIAWEVYDITKQKIFIGYIALAELIPAFILAFYGGYVVDKYNRKKIFASCVLLSLFTSFMFLYFIYLQVDNFTLVYIMMSVIFCSGIYRVFVGPTQTALVGELVPAQYYSRATTFYGASWQAAVVLGPPVIGFILGGTNLFFSEGVVCITLVIALVSSLCIKNTPRQIIGKVQNTFLQSIKQGWYFVYSTKELLASFILDTFGVLFGGVTSMLPVFIKDVYHQGAENLGLLRSAISIGTISVLLCLGFFPLTKKQGMIMLYSMFLFGVCMICVGITTHFWIAYFILLCSGIFDGISVNIRATILQLKTPDAIKGKVAAISTLFVMSSNEVGSLESATAAELFGLEHSVMIGGIITVLVVIIVGWRLPKFRKMSY